MKAAKRGLLVLFIALAVGWSLPLLSAQPASACCHREHGP